MKQEDKFFEYVGSAKSNVHFSTPSKESNIRQKDMTISDYLEENRHIGLICEKVFSEILNDKNEPINFNRKELKHIGSEGYSWVNYYEDSEYIYKVNETDPMSGAPNIITKFKKIQSVFTEKI